MVESMEFSAPLLARVEVHSSAVLNTNIRTCWNIGRDFGRNKWLSKAPGFHFSVLPGGTSGTEVGSTRVFMVGNAQLFEQLTALDDHEHIMRWICLSHPQTISPFHQASFVNYQSSLHMREVTIGIQTYAEWKGTFYTEPQYARYMQATLESWYVAGFKALQACSVKQSSMETTTRNSAAPCGHTAGVGGPEFPKDSSNWPMPQQVNNPALTSAQTANSNPSPAVMDSYLVNNRHFPGTPAGFPAHPAGPPSPTHSNTSEADQSGQGHAIRASQTFQAAKAALIQAGKGRNGRRHRMASDQIRQDTPQAGNEAEPQPPTIDTRNLKPAAKEASLPSTLSMSSYNTGTTDSKSSMSGFRSSNSHCDRNEAEFRRTEALRQYGSADLSCRLSQSDSPVSKDMENQTTDDDSSIAMNSDHYSPDDPGASRSASWDSVKCTYQDITPQAAKTASSLQTANEVGRRSDTPRKKAWREMAVVLTDRDAELMDSVSFNIAARRAQNETHRRSSFEEEAAMLSARHAALHSKRMSNGSCAQASTYTSPFAKPQESNSFAQQQATESPRGGGDFASFGSKLDISSIAEEDVSPKIEFLNPFAAA